MKNPWQAHLEVLADALAAPSTAQIGKSQRILAHRYLTRSIEDANERLGRDHPEDVMVWLLDRLETWTEVFM